MAEYMGVSVRRLGESSIDRECIGMVNGEKRLSCFHGRSSLTEEVSSERGGDLSDVRMGLSFFFMLSPWRSAGDWKCSLL